MRLELYRRVKEQVKSRLGGVEDLRSYSDGWSREFRGRWRASDGDELDRHLASAKMVLGADFHAYSQAQRVHLRMLRGLDEGRPVVLALECIESRFQHVLNEYLRGKITAVQLKRRVGWDRSWGFPFENYLPLLELAKKRAYPVLALNKHYARRSVSTLRRRDQHAARLLVKGRKSYPEHLFYVIFGELHLAKSHLPAEILKLKPAWRRQMLVLFQDSDRLYFQLARRGKETSVEVLKGSGNRFCVIASPPWVRWQSYLFYLEQTYDLGISSQHSGEGLDATDHVQDLVVFAARHLGLSVSTSSLAVYSSDHPNLKSVLDRKLSVEEREWAFQFIGESMSFYFPRTSVLYLSRPTVNHAATLAGYFLHAQLSKRKEDFLRFPENLTALIWVEAIGFFISKLVNHRRKAERLSDLKKQLNSLTARGQSREALLLVLEQRVREFVWIHAGRWRELRIKPRRSMSFVRAAKILGHMMGDRLFAAHQAGRFSRAQLVKWLSLDPGAPGFLPYYEELIRRLESERPRRSRRGVS